MKLNFYDRMYYLMYLMLGRLGNYDLGFKSMMLLSMLMTLNVITIISLFFDKSILRNFTTYTSAGLAVLPLIVFNYFYFVYDKRYEKISNLMLFRKTSIDSFGGPIYIILTIVFLMYSIT